ncbi:hypothetical protein [Aureimonas psammosilenae]|uniref:hypothetical protein n=1 Tax=Aureimonas psammosilenae TaxID=2495496 RepID=UPI001260E1C9|nr:hypothetical protein [Aureimonas psammosilenae]
MPRQALALSFLALSGLIGTAFAQGSAAQGSAPAGETQAIEAACEAASSAALDDVTATRDPTGTKRYGLALVSGVQKGTRDTRSVICLYDRQSKRAEVGGLLDLANATDAAADFPVGAQVAPGGTAATLIYPGSATCGQDCLAHWTAISAADQNQLLALPEQVRRTLAETATQPITDAGAKAARNAAASVVAAAGGQPDKDTAGDLTGVAPGERQCTVYHFGQAGEPAKQVARDRCRVDRLSDGGLNLVRLSGDNLTLQLQLLENGVAVAGGRDAPSGPPPGGYDLSRPVDPANTNYGNLVGLGIARTDGRVYVASIEQRQLAARDATFFMMIAVDAAKGK